MPVSKAWEWSREPSAVWLTPSEESHALSHRWKERGFETLLDLGCGLGRHAVFFAKKGFRVSAFDLSEEGTGHLREWAAGEGLDIAVRTADMLHMPYPDGAFDCVWAYHVVSHTDTAGLKTVLSEIRRVLRPGGEVFMSLCSKDTWSFREAGYPRLDPYTAVKTGGGPEDGVPHVYVDLDDRPGLFAEFSLLRVRHTDDCWFDGHKQNSKHYFILAGDPI